MPAAQYERSPRSDRPPAVDRAGQTDHPDGPGEPGDAGPGGKPGQADTRPSTHLGWTGIDLLALLGGLSGRRARQRGEPTRWSRRAVAILAVIVAVLGSAIVLRGYLPADPRLLVYGDSLIVESQEPFKQAALDAGAHAIELRAWSGTAPCNWVDDVPGQIRDFRPTVAVLAFSGNLPACMTGRDLLTGYRQDVTTMVDQLVSAGVQVRLVEEPARKADPVDASGRTELGRLWATIARETPNTRVVRADLAVTAAGRFVPSLPCDPGEPCGPDGQITVRAPDGVHFCPNLVGTGGSCGVYSSGAHRYGAAVARGALD
ncbi:hypothetical protein I6A60_06905 [Frankia sp. AgB1.9]|uniref:hypothetical protein n=1 Tax=unclassified Frankia TaxID=2632575 RepID=UPI0019323F57|nr:MULTISPECIES: hypothetical protein [unclassified Frankia]MBL7488866.1 hypothetical protein [Frankia sp. AgW1.1]MBL7547602.1 hypothetical protein [Frankia sp. AgB1.9]MBL7621481.1 hypothetical protein [Frankia sp. AgB1.8]